MACLRSFYVADDIWRFAWSLVGCLLASSAKQLLHREASTLRPTTKDAKLPTRVRITNATPWTRRHRSSGCQG